MTDEPTRADKRIGERTVVEPIDVVWALAGRQAQGRLRRKKPSIVGHPGQIVDVSVTGAAIDGPEHPDLFVGAEAAVVFEHGRSVVRIKRWVPTDRPDVIRYGVEYENLDQALRDAIFTAVGRDRPGETAWRRAW